MSSDPPAGWRTVRVGEVAEIVGGGTPSTRVAENFGGEIPWITPKDLSGREEREIGAGERSLSRQGLKACSAQLLPERAVLLSTRAPIGRVAIARNPVSTSQGFRSLVLKPGHAPEFFYYLLKGRTETLEGRAGGSTFRELSGTSLKQTEFPIPPLEEQETIGRVLASLDDKLASNRRVIRISEELLELRFKSRFAADQPGTCPIGDLIEVVGGSTPSTGTDEYWSGGIHCWATPKDLSGLRSPVLVDTSRHLTDAGLAKTGSGSLPAGTVLMSCRAPIGYTAIAGVSTAVNQGFIAIPPSDKLPSAYVLCWLRENMHQIKAHAGGTTFAEIGKRTFRRIPMHVPPPDALAEFDRFATPLLDLAMGRERESRTLLEIRDLLLPRLISGTYRFGQGRGKRPPERKRSDR
jgi:type I restriction enzyme, S subunit